MVRCSLSEYTLEIFTDGHCFFFQVTKCRFHCSDFRRFSRDFQSRSRKCISYKASHSEYDQTGERRSKIQVETTPMNHAGPLAWLAQGEGESVRAALRTSVADIYARSSVHGHLQIFGDEVCE